MRRLIWSLCVAGLLGSLAPAAYGAATPTRECHGYAVTISGTDRDDVIDGTEGADVVAAGAGDDVVNSLGGDDVVCGGRGADVLTGGDGFNQLHGDAGDDVVVGGDEHDLLWGSNGADTLLGAAGADNLYGDNGDDVLRAGDDTGVDHCGTDNLCDLLQGGPGDDMLDGEIGGSPDAAVYARVDRGMRVNLTRGTARGQGHDTLISMEGVRICCSRPANDRIVGTVRNDYIEPGSGLDIVRGRAGDDYVFEEGDGVPVGGDTFRLGRGDDYVISNGGQDIVDTGRGDDYVERQPVADELTATVRLGRGADSMVTSGTGAMPAAIAWGGGGDDDFTTWGARVFLHGGPGDDDLAGADWDDRLFGGTGLDTAVAGDGRDKCAGVEDQIDCEY